MELEALLEGARLAPPDRRIEARDPIAAFGARGIEAVRPWLTDDPLAAFAVRVVEQAGLNGEPELATKTLRAARSTVSPDVAGDVDWALQRLKDAARPDARPAPAAPRVAAPARRATVARATAQPIRRRAS